MSISVIVARDAVDMNGGAPAAAVHQRPFAVAQDDALLTRSVQSDERHPLERLEIDAVAPHAGRPSQLHVSKDAALAH
jgi:hypothetical protein